jgi:hypothetical protein
MLIKMLRADDNHAVDVHPDMVTDYESGGYRIVDTAPADEGDDAPRQRGRPRKVTGDDA